MEKQRFGKGRFVAPPNSKTHPQTAQERTICGGRGATIKITELERKSPGESGTEPDSMKNREKTQLNLARVIGTTTGLK